MSSHPSSSSTLATIDHGLRAALVAMVRKRVPERDVEDIVQSALAEAVESPNAPNDQEALRKWIFGVAKNKVVDYHRRAARESFEMPEVSGKPAPHAEADLLRWAQKNLPEGEDAQKTLGWMIREGDGEKLESIAESEHVPAPRVRQRVSRLRRHFKANWQREVALLAALGVIVSVAVALYLRSKRPEPIADDPRAVPLDPRDPRSPERRADEIRKDALEKCRAALYEDCIHRLDEAKRLDPAGDTRPAVQRARQDAENATTPPPPAPSMRLQKAPPSKMAPSSETFAPPAPTSKTAPRPTSTDDLGSMKQQPAPPPSSMPAKRKSSMKSGSSISDDWGARTSGSDTGEGSKDPPKPAATPPAKAAGRK